ncbi:MAG: twin-arginine translocase TatA/TatE family subunit [Acidimicrobiales bacterium]|nr:twin-arginine translocase TatA/TatE family subunit [Acidimicrobiales bacterium]
MTGLMQGYDLFIVLALVALLFGASQLPKLARALGSASHEFKRGTEEGMAAEAAAAKEEAGKEEAAKEATVAHQHDGTKESVTA